MLTHPAVAVAQERTAGLDGGPFTATAIRTQDGMAAVVMDSDTARYVIIMEQQDGAWIAPAVLVGSPRPNGPRAERTPDYRPLQRLSHKRTDMLGDAEDVWFAATGLAAGDAREIVIKVDGAEIRESIRDDGLAFAVARVPRGQKPEIIVRTQDGRVVLATH